MSFELPVTSVIINYKTPDLTSCAITSFRGYYPAARLILIDNGSHDGSSSILNEFTRQTPDSTELIVNEHNRHHGPAMHQALLHADTPYVLFLDSDCEVVKGGFIERMVSSLEQNTHHYAAGKLVFMNRRGFDVAAGVNTIPYIRPICMLLKRELYWKLPPFQHHGTPCLANMKEASAQEFVLIDVPVDEYVMHKGRGTAGQYGYGLGWKGKLNHLMNKIGL